MSEILSIVTLIMDTASLILLIILCVQAYINFKDFK